MANWCPFHRWMAHSRLDEHTGLTCAFTIGYRITDDFSDQWTTRFNHFKQKQRRALLGGTKVMSHAVPKLVSGLGLNPSKTMFVPALSSAETVASENGVLWQMTHVCAQAACAGFVGNALRKNSHESLHNVSSASRRREILDAAEFKSEGIGAEYVLIFDDFITRGSTMSHIAQAILSSNPACSIYGVALGKMERRNYWQKFGVEISNDHIPEEWTRQWEAGEAAR